GIAPLLPSWWRMRVEQVQRANVIRVVRRNPGCEQGHQNEGERNDGRHHYQPVAQERMEQIAVENTRYDTLLVPGVPGAVRALRFHGHCSSSLLPRCECADRLRRKASPQ